MAGLYLHIPFCKKACHYCNFHFSTSLNLKNDFLKALQKEIELSTSPDNMEANYLGDEIVETVYFGGGTPSLLEKEELNEIMSKLNNNFNISSSAEITFEANPDDINPQKLKDWKAVGINRLSIGVQSFFNEDLVWMNRAHNSDQSLFAITAALEEGFDNFSIDLIYGSPGLTTAKWGQNVQQAIQIGVPHLSCYALTVEPLTALNKMILQKKSDDVDPEKQAAQFLLLADWTEAAGYEQYEISNFAKPGKRSRHNSSYWQGKKYLGLGPSAHSFNGNSRQWNVANNAVYIQLLNGNTLPVEKEFLTETQQLNEYIMTSLRTVEGINTGQVEDRFGKEAVSHIYDLSRKFIVAGKIKATGNVLQLTREGKLYADGIASDLFR